MWLCLNFLITSRMLFLCSCVSNFSSNCSTADRVITSVLCFNIEYTFNPYIGIRFMYLIESVAIVIFFGIASDLKIKKYRISSFQFRQHYPSVTVLTYQRTTPTVPSFESWPVRVNTPVPVWVCPKC